MSLAVKYRPKDFNEVVGQESIIKILQRQVESGQHKNCYLFSGKSGCGKTTIARILANKINKDFGHPIEIDAASQSGVESIRNIIDSASQRSLDSEYKIFIIDECHALSSSAWQALLKTIEETPKYTIFMFCTTEYHKVPVTIQNRCQQYFLSIVPDDQIIDRLNQICKAENIIVDPDAISYIAKVSQGSVRLAISTLEQVLDYGPLTINNALAVIGDYSYDIYFNLLNDIMDKNSGDIIKIIDKVNNNGDLKVFLDLFIDFVLDVNKYAIFKSYDIIKIPKILSKSLDYAVNIENPSNYFNYLLNKLLVLKQQIKGDSSIKNTIQIYLMNI